MKQFKIFFLITFAIIFSACSSDDDSNSSSNIDLIGAWQGISVDYESTSTISAQGQNLITNCEGEGFDLNFQITFSDNPNEYVSTGAFSVTLICMALGQTFEQTSDDISILGDGTWRLENNVLFLKDDGNEDEVGAEITELSNGNLQLRIEETEVFQDNSISTSTTITVDMILERL